jgi:hypothetical protein
VRTGKSPKQSLNGLTCGSMRTHAWCTAVAAAAGDLCVYPPSAGSANLQHVWRPYTYTQLRARARNRLKDGRLPPCDGVLLKGFDGIESCVLCDGRIGAGELVYKIELPFPPNKTTLYLHVHCHKAWQAEWVDRSDRTLA